MKQSQPLEFLKKAEKDRKLSARVTAALERGGKVTAEEILQIAEEFGYTFTKREFEREVKRAFAARYAAIREAIGPPPGAATTPPDSACSKGCVSWSTNYCPDRFQGK